MPVSEVTAVKGLQQSQKISFLLKCRSNSTEFNKNYVNKQTHRRQILCFSRETPQVKILSIPSTDIELSEQTFICCYSQKEATVCSFPPCLLKIISRVDVTQCRSRKICTKPLEKHMPMDVTDSVPYKHNYAKVKDSYNYLLKRSELK